MQNESKPPIHQHTSPVCFAQSLELREEFMDDVKKEATLPKKVKPKK